MLEFYRQRFTSRLILGSALYPSPEVFQHSVKAAGAEIVTVSLRREGAKERTGARFWRLELLRWEQTLLRGSVEDGRTQVQGTAVRQALAGLW